MMQKVKFMLEDGQIIEFFEEKFEIIELKDIEQKDI
jgi:hypothetical protein